MRIEKRETIAAIMERLRPDVQLIHATVEVTETCNQEGPTKTAKWTYSETCLSAQSGRLFAGNLPFATSQFQGEGPIFAALNEAIYGREMKEGRHQRTGPLTTYQSDDGKAVTRTYKAVVEFKVKELGEGVS
ncbi:MAG TPA: hypothetical protein VGR78_17420 [Verrucomicrobiae bacterium]|jgi:hypothetical protein|nr:hypothetical protein [Verrucomicrobiae bacterium]